MAEIDFSKIEKKWQKAWEEKKAFQVKEGKGKKYYCLEMFPYPSGSGLHMGHAFNYTIGDIYARFMRMKGFNVLYPMGYDSFGLPAENAAIKAAAHPKKFTESAIANFISQQKSLGLSYDWSRMLKTSEPEYYKWNQFFFLKFLEKGLVYRKKSGVNWCSKCDSVLANEQVHNGKCWRHTDTDVEIKQLEQWFIKTTEYADELLEDIIKLDWPEKIKTMQKNWIGKSFGTEILFEINGKKWAIFTTRPDTLFGVTFMVVSAQHPKLMELVTDKQRKSVEDFLKKIKSTSEKDFEALEKEGVFTGSYAVNPMTNEKVPVYAGNFVVADYGSGMVMAVPAHDARDFEFAKKYNIPIKEVIQPVYVNTSGSDAYRKNEPKVEIKAVVAIIKNPKNNKYLLLQWKKNDWRGFVIGGIESGEDLLSAAKREIEEETGYTDIKFIKKIEGVVHSKFYHETKKQNRDAHFETLYFELNSDKRNEISKEESKIHNIVWIDENKVDKFLVRDNDILIIWKRFRGQECYESFGKLINSGAFSELDSDEAKEHITKALEFKKLGKKTIQYKLRDWLISRQRYWGTPIPIVYCAKCGIIPVPEKELPVKLPENVKFGKGNPLATDEKWIKIKCPKCKGDARRETDTMDTFFDSSWYYLRYADNKNSKIPFDKSKVNYWMPIDQYIGGAEHACMHLIYARFFTKALRDLGYLKIDEPFLKLFNQGMLHGEDGAVMSKSRGNVVLPEEVSKKYGIDTARIFLMSVALPEKDTQWSDKGIEGSLRFIKKVFETLPKMKTGKSSRKIESRINKTIKELSEEIVEFRYNLAIIKLRKIFEAIEQESEVSKKDIESFLKMLSVFAPHIAEEIWNRIGNKSFISLEKWPIADEKKIDLNLEKSEEAVEKTIEDILNILKIIKEKQGKDAENVYLYAIPNEFENYNSEVLSRRIGKEVKVFAVNDRSKYDPENKSSKAKPNRPAIFVE